MFCNCIWISTWKWIKSMIFQVENCRVKKFNFFIVIEKPVDFLAMHWLIFTFEFTKSFWFLQTSLTEHLNTACRNRKVQLKLSIDPSCYFKKKVYFPQTFCNNKFYFSLAERCWNGKIFFFLIGNNVHTKGKQMYV